MITSFHRFHLRPLGQGLAIVVLLAGMALMAFAASLALLGAMIGVPMVIGVLAVRQRFRSGSEPPVAETLHRA